MSPAFRPMDDDVLFDERTGDHGVLHTLTCPEAPPSAVRWAKGVAVWRDWAPEEHRGHGCWPRVEVVLGSALRPAVSSLLVEELRRVEDASGNDERPPGREA